MQWWGNRGGQGNYPRRHMTHDAGGGKNSALGKGSGNMQVSEKGPGPSLFPTSQETKNKETSSVASSSTSISNDPTSIASGSTTVVKQSDMTVASVPELVPSHDSWLPSGGTEKSEVASHQTPVEQISVPHAAPSEVASSLMQGKMTSKPQETGKNQLSESSLLLSSTHGSSSVSRPSSNYNSRSQAVGPPKVGHGKEWKPKPINPSLAQGLVTAASSEVSSVTIEVDTQSQAVSSVFDSKEANSELQSKLEELHISDGRHVIIPDHLHVPDAEKLGFCFGSFDNSFRLITSCHSGPEGDKSPPPPLSETSEEIEETMEEQSSSHQNTLATAEGDYADHPPSSLEVPENSDEADVTFSVVPQYTKSKQENVLPHAGHQYSAVHTSPSNNFGLMLGGQLAPLESSESQVRDVSRLPGFVVQQPFDQANYYAQFYRSGADTDGRVSPFHAPGVTMKYNGNVVVVSPQTSQSPQEVGNSYILSAGPTPLVGQAAGVMQSSIAQQPLHVFRQPTGMHHYPPNYIPYGHYFSPFYVPPPAIHQFLSNGAFLQQPPAGGVCPAPPVAATKYPLSQHKPGINTGNSPHIGVPSSYGPYSSSISGYNPSSVMPAGKSSNEDLAASKFKENYLTSQQSDGSGLWIAAPGRDISGWQASSLYNLPQGQQTFTPTHGGHGTFPGIYHHPQMVTAPTVHPLLQQSQTMAGAVDMVVPTGSVYQQPQHAQINWPSGY
ncbi:unnamed protein product [Ilex paraguariensis]